MPEQGSAPDWERLRSAASAALASAYAPYSGLRVGAAAVTADGRTVTGCNVENASYGLSLCAECVLVAVLVAGGGGQLVAVACVAGQEAAEVRSVITPCGRCRQVLLEHAGPGCLIDTPAGPRSLGELLPAAFGPGDLPAGVT